MNRKDKRAFLKSAKKKGVDRQLAELYLRIKEKGIQPQTIVDGDKVKLNMKAIQSHPDYNRLSDKYKSFVTENVDTIFTVQFDPRSGNLNAIVSLKEDSTRWLFWVGDLTKVNE